MWPSRKLGCKPRIVSRETHDRARETGSHATQRAVLRSRYSHSRRMSLHPVRVVLVDDHEIVRDGMRARLTDQDGLVIVGECGSAEDALQLAHDLAPNVVVLDIGLPDRSGLDIVTELKATVPQARILIFSGHTETQYGVRCLKLGADGFLSKASPSHLLVEAVRKVASGGKYLSPTLAEALAASVGDKKMAAPHEQLSSRELDVFLRIARGQSLTAISHELGLSVKTVGTYRARVLEKTSSHSNADLTRLALTYNMLQ